MSTHAYTPRHSITIRPIGGITLEEIQYCVNLLTVTEAEIQAANKDFASLKSLFQRIVKFIQSKKKSALKM